MKTKYYRYTLEGEHSAEEAQRALGDDAADGLIVRIDNVKGQTHLYLAQGSAAKTDSTKATATSSRYKVKEVSEKDLTKFG